MTLKVDAKLLIEEMAINSKLAVDHLLIRVWRGIHGKGDPPRRIQLAFDRESMRRIARHVALQSSTKA